MRKTLIIVAAVIVVLVAALLIAPALIPVETYKNQILAQVEKATGRKARIDGDFSFSLLPRVEFTAGKVSLANAPGMQPENMVTLDRLNVRVAVFPLLRGNLVIDSFVLEKPVIALAVDRQGRANWQFAPQGASTPAQRPAEAPREGGGGGGPALEGLQLGDVRLVDGRVSYSDARTDASYAAEDIDMKISLPSLQSPMALDGELTWNKERIKLALGVAQPNAFLEAKPTGVTASVSSNPVKLSFKGQASQDKVIKANGTLDLDVPSVRKLAAWAGQPIAAPGDGLGPLKISGTVEIDGPKAAFRQAKLSLDKIEASGDFRFDGSGRRPYVNARMQTGVLDINPYLPPEGQKPAAGGDKPAPGGAPPAAASQGWSDEPIDVSGLRAADADLELAVAGLVMRKIKIGPSKTKLTLKGGQLAVELAEMALYEGKGTAKVTLDSTKSVPAMTAAFDLAGVQANPVLSDAAGFDRLEGTANADMQVTAQGRSQRAMVSALNGKGKVRFTDGAIRGINLAAMVRNVQSAFLDPSAKQEQKTDFSELSGSYTIRNGILTNDDLALMSPLLRVTGKGTIDLPQRTVNYRVEPKLAATTSGQGGPADASGVMVPVVVTGPWDNLSYRPDLAGALGGIAKDPSKALEGLKDMLPGGKDGGAAPSGEQKAPEKPGVDTLKKLFGR